MRNPGFKHLIVGLLIVALALSGCTGKKAGTDDTINDKPVEVTTGAETGGILGTVISEDDLPIAGAQVLVKEVPGAAIQETNDLGQFGFSELAPGEYTINIQRLGYKPFAGEKVTVTAGQVTSQDFVLAAIAIAEPFSDPMQQDGVIVASAGWNVGDPCTVPGGTCNGINVPVEAVNVHKWAISDDAEDAKVLETIVAEMVWTATSGVCKGEFSFELTPPGVELPISPSETRVFYGETTTSPSRIFATRQMLVDLGISPEDPEDSSDADGEWTTRVFSHSGGTTSNAMADAGCALQQDFTIHLTAFYNGPAPDGFTAVVG